MHAMDAPTREALNAINRAFYERHAGEFSATRDRAWRGWERVWRLCTRLGAGRDARGADAALRLLDVGCGNGRLGRFVRERSGAALDYTGVDASAQLLAEARRALAPAPSSGMASSGMPAVRGPARGVGPDLVRLDLARDDALRRLPPRPFDLVAVFGVLHHLPGFARRRALLAALAGRVAPGGVLALGAWQFWRPELQPRFARRRLSWEAYNAASPRPVDTRQLERGDHLLRWGARPKAGVAAGAAGLSRARSTALRYCHHSDDDELERLLDAVPLTPVDRFRADGRSDDLNRYVVLQRRG